MMNLNSDDVSKMFNKQHKSVLGSIRTLIRNIMNIGNDYLKYFKDSSYLDSRGKTYPRYELTRKGFDLLVLGFTGEKALKYKLWFIDEFYRKSEIIEKDKALAKEHLKDDMFVSLRNETKDIRKLFTEVIQECELPQRISENKDASRFVGVRVVNYTRLVYKKLDITLPKGANPRDILSPLDIMKIAMLEDKITEKIRKNTKNGIGYKESYSLIKTETLQD